MVYSSAVRVMISMLRGVNLGPHNRVKMDELRAMYASLGLRDIQTYVQSGNVIFGTDKGGAALVRKIEEAIARKFGFRCDVVIRTTAELRDVVARNPFKGRHVVPEKLLGTFLAHSDELSRAVRFAAQIAIADRVEGARKANARQELGGRDAGALAARLDGHIAIALGIRIPGIDDHFPFEVVSQILADLRQRSVRNRDQHHVSEHRRLSRR